MYKFKNNISINQIIIIITSLYICLDLYVGSFGFLPYWTIKGTLIIIDILLCLKICLGIGTTVFHSYKLARKKFNEPINYVTSFYLIYFLMFGIVENAAINIEPLFMLFLLITAQLNYSRDFDFKDLYNNTCFRKGYKI